MEGPFRKQVIMESEGRMYLRNFEDIRVSTMTLVAFIEGNVKNLDPLYFLLPCRHPSSPRIEQLTAGTITSVRHKECYIGKAGSCFKNAIIINITTDEKEISTKLSTCKIQMCGPRSTRMGEEAAKYVAEHVNDSINFLKEIARETQRYIAAVEWVLANTAGEEIVTHVPVECDGLQLYRRIDDHKVRWPVKQAPQELSYFAEQVMRRCDVCDFTSEIRSRCEYYMTLDPEAISDPLSIVRVGRAMVNYNYKLGFYIDRLKLMELLMENGIGVDYPNTVRAHVTIEIYGKKIEDPDIVRRDENCNKQVILIYFSGNVMHSGPGGATMEKYYYKIMGLIAENRNRVMSVANRAAQSTTEGETTESG